MNEFRGCDFFIIGAPKSGTTAMASYLSEHSKVEFSVPKEPFYYSTDFPLLRKLTGVDTAAKYEECFSGIESGAVLRGEGSTNYLRSECAVRNILNDNPDARFVIMLRNPKEACVAFHGELLFSVDEDIKDFEAAWNAQNERKLGGNIPKTCTAEQFLQYGEGFLYGAQLSRLFGLVKRRNILVVLYDDFCDSAKSEYAEVLRFLQLNDEGKTDFERKYASGQQRFYWLASFVLRPPKPLEPAVKCLRRWYQRQNGFLFQKIRGVMRVKKERSELSDQIKAELSNYFDEDIKKLEALLGRDLSKWYQ